MFAISPLQSDFDEANRLVAEAIGPGWYSAEKLEAMAEAPDSRLFCARDASEALLGVASAKLLAAEDLTFYRVFGEAAAVLDGKRVGSLNLSAVVPRMRGRGLGSELARARLAWLRERGCDYAVGISWQSGLAHTSQTVFERHAFVVLAESSTFFAPESEKYGYGCPVCGSACHCRALFFGRAL